MDRQAGHSSPAALSRRRWSADHQISGIAAMSCCRLMSPRNHEDAPIGKRRRGGVPAPIRHRRSSRPRVREGIEETRVGDAEPAAGSLPAAERQQTAVRKKRVARAQQIGEWIAGVREHTGLGIPHDRGRAVLPGQDLASPEKMRVHPDVRPWNEIRPLADLRGIGSLNGGQTDEDRGRQR